MSASTKIACIGEVMIELATQPDGHAKLGVAGDTYNTAVYLRRLLPADSYAVSFATALGDDTFSDRIFQAMQAHEVETDLVVRREGMLPGLYAINTDELGERSFSYWRQSSAARSLFQMPSDDLFSKLAEFDLLYLSGITLAILSANVRARLFEFLKDFRLEGGIVAFDSNYRKQLWDDVGTARSEIMTMWSLTDIALPSGDDELALFEETDENQVLKRLQAAGVSYGALKRGSLGPLAIGDPVAHRSYCAAPNIVDTTAAGDSFNAGFLAAWIQGHGVEKALKEGHRLASKVIQAPGAIVDIG